MRSSPVFSFPSLFLSGDIMQENVDRICPHECRAVESDRNTVDSVEIISHGDVDGVCAAALLLAAHPNAKMTFTQPTQIEDALKNTNARLVLIADIAFPAIPKRRDDLVALLQSMGNAGRTVRWYDHHANPPVELPGVLIVIRSRDMSASMLVYRLTASVPRNLERVARYGNITDGYEKTWDEFERHEIRLLDFALRSSINDQEFRSRVARTLSQGGQVSEVAGVEERCKATEHLFAETRRKVSLALQPKADKLLVSFVKDPNYGVMGRIASELSGSMDTVVAILFPDEIQPDKYVILTIRRPREWARPNLSDVMNDLVSQLGDGCEGGGHPGSVGGKILREHAERFVSLLAADATKW